MGKDNVKPASKLLTLREHVAALTESSNGPARITNQGVSRYRLFFHEHGAELVAALDEHYRLCERVRELEAALDKCTGMFAERGVCEPVEGFVERPQDLEKCIAELGARDAK